MLLYVDILLVVTYMDMKPDIIIISFRFILTLILVPQPLYILYVQWT
jgi:hypothetical protein